MEDKKQKLLEELAKYENKLAQLVKDWSETRAGSRYGDEYGGIQIKVYEQMIEGIKNDLKNLKP